MSKIYYEEIGGARLALRKGTPDRHVAKSCLAKGEFAVCKTLIPELEFNFIIDAGGYIGTAAIWFAMRYPQATVLSIEPSKENFTLLTENVSAFPNIIPVNAAIVARSRSVDLLDRGTGNWGFSVVEKPRDNPNPESLHAIDGVTLDELIYGHQKTGVDILKLDIEGGEKELFDFPGYWIHHSSILIAELHNRIIAGCGESFRNATSHLKVVPDTGGEKIVAVNPDLVDLPIT